MPSRGTRCLDHLAVTSTQDEESNKALTHILIALQPLSAALLTMVLSHLHTLEKAHVLQVFSEIAASESNDTLEQIRQTSQRKICVARPELHLLPLGPRSNVLRYPSPGVDWQNRIGSLIHNHTHLQDPFAILPVPSYSSNTKAAALAGTEAAASNGQPYSTLSSANTEATKAAAHHHQSNLLQTLSICDLDNAIMARMHHLLHAPHIQSSLQCLSVSHTNTRPQFLQSLAQATALTSLHLSHIWGLAAADELRFSLSHLSELRVLHLSQVHLAMLRTPLTEQPPLEAAFSKLTDLKLASTDITTCHALYVPVFKAAPLSMLKELSVGYSVANTSAAIDAVAAWPPDSQLTHLDTSTELLKALNRCKSPVLEHVVSLSLDAGQPMASNSAIELAENDWVALQTMQCLQDLELCDISLEAQKQALRSLAKAQTQNLKHLQLTCCSGSDGVAEFLTCRHFSLTSLSISARNGSYWTVPGQLAVLEVLLSHTKLVSLTWDIADRAQFGQTAPTLSGSDLAEMHMKLQTLSSLQGLTELVLSSLEAIGGPGVHLLTREAVLVLPNLRTLACDLGSVYGLPEESGDGYHGGGTVQYLHQLSALEKLENLQLRISDRCDMRHIVSLLSTPGLSTRLRLLSLSNIPLSCPGDGRHSTRFADIPMLEAISTYTALEELHLHAAPVVRGILSSGGQGSSHPASQSNVTVVPGAPDLHFLISHDESLSRLVPFCSYFQHLRCLQALVLNGVGYQSDVEELIRLGLPLQRGAVYM